MRQLVITDDVGAAIQDQDMDAYIRQVVADGRETMTIYDSTQLERPDAVARARAFRAAGERQRIADGVPTEFLSFGTEAVVCVETWGDPASDYVLVRDPMLVRALRGLLRRDVGPVAALPLVARRATRTRTSSCSTCSRAASRTRPSPATSAGACAPCGAGWPG